MQRSPTPLVHHFKTWLIRGGWVVVLIVGYYVAGYFPFTSGLRPSSYYLALYFHKIFGSLFWLVLLAIAPISLLLLLLKALFRRHIRWPIIGWCISYMLAIVVLFFPIGGYVFENGPALEVNDWGRSYHVSLFTFDDEGLLSLYECGSLKLLCHRIFSDCNNFGPRFQERMSLQWTDDRLSLYNQNTLYYQRTKDAVLFDWAEEYGSPVRSPCRYSLWTP
ncbi:MAG: hypothetical protein WBA57_00255 [Elainellaceae cyanobacterium]